MVKTSKKKDDSKTSVKKKEKIVDGVIEEKQVGNVNKKIVEKKIVKKNIDDKKAFLIISLAVLLVIILFYFLFFYSPYKYSFVVSDVPFYSNYYTPSAFFDVIKSEDVVFISPAFVEGDISPIVVNAMQLWNVILSANNINVVQLVRVFDGDKLSYCQTNRGSVEVNDVLSKEECEEIIGNDSWKIFIEVGKRSVVIGENIVTITSSREDSSVVNFVVIKEVFPNAEQAFDIINQKIYDVA